ncbi:MAG TPA: dicarboxylate/amino acid:cation symporter [Pirellulales bacterium]
MDLPDPSPPADNAPPPDAAPAAASPAEPRRRVPLHLKILLGLIVGVVTGLAANAASSPPIAGQLARLLGSDAAAVEQGISRLALEVADPLGRVFLRLVLMVVVPLVFSALALGVLELGDLRRVGRVGLRTLLLTLLLSSLAVGIGLVLVNWIRPGERLPPEQRAALREQYQGSAEVQVERAAHAKSVAQTLLDIIPENPLEEMVGALSGTSRGGGMLAVMFFSLMFGAALSMTGTRGETLVRFLEGLFDVSMTIIGFAMRLAPLCVACLVFSVTARLGFDILKTLAWFALTVLVGMAVQMAVVYPLALLVFAKRRPGRFYAEISEAMLTAFGTSSSNATLPVALRVAQNKLRLPREISQFVLTIGSTGNQNGTALYEGVVVLFLAQAFGVELSLTQQLTVVLMSILAGVGTAGVPGGSIPLVVLVLKSVNVPGEGIAIILGIDRLLDMCRTVLNVSGDLVLAACVAGEDGGSST